MVKVRCTICCVAMRDYQESVTIGQTDTQTDGRTVRLTPDKVIPMCRYASQATQKLGHYDLKGGCCSISDDLSCSHLLFESKVSK